MVLQHGKIVIKTCVTVVLISYMAGIGRFKAVSGFGWEVFFEPFNNDLLV